MGSSYLSDTGLIQQSPVKSGKIPVLFAVGFGAKPMCTGMKSHFKLCLVWGLAGVR